MGLNWSNMWSLAGDNAALPEPEACLSGMRLDEAEKQKFLERTARAIVRRRLTVPAILALESLQPLSFISSQALLVLSPLLSLVLNCRDLQTLYLLLEERTGLERLLALIEQYDGEQCDGEMR